MSESQAVRHVPVLAQRCVELLAPAVAAGGTIVDATLGMGGHSALLLERLPLVRVVGIDRDPQAIALATARLAPFGDRFTAVHATYDEIGEIAAEYGGLHGVLMDLGVSSLQLDEAALPATPPAFSAPGATHEESIWGSGAWSAVYNRKLKRWFEPQYPYFTDWSDPQKGAYRFRDVGGASASGVYFVGSIWDKNGSEQVALYLAAP